MKIKFQLRLEESQMKAIQSLLTKNERITDFFREALDKEIAFRKQQKEPTA